ncbi:hypothetical protein FHG87_019644 [Trinorchestia longiramus]|nr:hypothetical protein FHG87_019644 [Trinorchestia longiramus]
MVSAVCSDRAPVMLGRKSGFSTVVKADAPNIIVTHCTLHRHALATKTLPPKLAEVLKIVVESVNYIRISALRHCIFSELCKEMGSEFVVLLYHSNIRWLPRGQIFIPFVTTHLCEQSFSSMLDIKTKKRNRLCCKNDMTVALAKVKPRIAELDSERQQKSH